MYVAKSSSLIGLHFVTLPSPNNTYGLSCCCMPSSCPDTDLKNAVGLTIEYVMFVCDVNSASNYFLIKKLLNYKK